MQLISGLKNIVKSREWQLIIFFALAKLLVHFFTYTNFELHRDAYLFYAQSEHLAWGYFSVPPAIAVIGKLATLLFGNTTFALRFFPALIGAINIIIIGLAVKELGGKKIALALACMAYLLSPAYLHTSALFQPVSFNHFFWILSGYLILLMVNRNEPKLWIWVGIVFGLGFLAKYSIAFFLAGFAISLLFSPARSLYFSKYFLVALALGLVIIAPNIHWQYQNNWPVLSHMALLRETQLVHMKLSDFIADQFLMNFHALILWFGGLLVLLFYKKERKYQLFGLLYVIVIGLLILGSGKSYYSLGVYPLLFAFGGYFLEKYVTKYLIPIASVLIVFMFISLYVSLSMDGIPFVTFEQAVKKDAFRWEDGNYHDLPQDMADMTGWKEIGQTVSEIYLNLGPENKNNCHIFCYHYGQAGAVMFYGKKNDIPHPNSFNDSFVFWAADSISKEYMIWVHSDLASDIDPDTYLPERFDDVTLMATIDNKYFRENGTKIYLCRSPNQKAKEDYKSLLNQYRNMYQ